MTTRLNVDIVSATFGMYIDDFYRLCRFHNLATGKKVDPAYLAENLNSRSSFRADFFRLANLIRRKEQDAMSVADLAVIVALALRGPASSASGEEFAVPATLLEILSTGLRSEEERIQRQRDDLALRQSHPQTSAGTAHRFRGDEEDRVAPVSQELENGHTPNRRIHSANHTLLSDPELVEILERIEWMGITLEHRLNDIERYVSRIAPDGDESGGVVRHSLDSPGGVSFTPLSEIAPAEASLGTRGVVGNAAQADDPAHTSGWADAIGAFFRRTPATHSRVLNDIDSRTVGLARGFSGAEEVRRFPYPVVAVSLLLFGILILSAITWSRRYDSGHRDSQRALQNRTRTEQTPRETIAGAAVAPSVGPPYIAPATIPSKLSRPQGGTTTKTLPGFILDRPTAGNPQVLYPLPAQAQQSPITGNGEEEASAKQEIIETLSGWAQAARSNDVKRESSFYAPTLARYFLRRIVSREFVERDKQSYRERGNFTQSFAISDLSFKFSSDATVVVSLSKSWAVVGPSDTGQKIHTTRSRLWLEKLIQGWKIVGEQDLIGGNRV